MEDYFLKIWEKQPLLPLSVQQHHHL